MPPFEKKHKYLLYFEKNMTNDLQAQPIDTFDPHHLQFQKKDR